MNESSINRREMIAGSMAVGGSMGLLLGSPATAATSAAKSVLDFDDPAARARALAKVKGSCAEETVYTFCRLHLYLWLNDGNLQPMLSMQNLNVATWKPLPTGNYLGTVREVGIYTAFDTDEPVDHWVNPVTGDKREVWQFFGGPLRVEIGPNGIETGADATLKPKEMRIDLIGDKLLIPNQSAFSFPNPFRAEQ